jgi:ectoine hydroxylase-related dioxygenase (phytanoyl-CoA dioxygenase family)
MNFIKEKKEFKKKGYIIVKFESIEKHIEKINTKIDLHLKKKNKIKTNPRVFHYNKSPRIVEAWKNIPEIKKIAYDRNIIKLLKILKKRDPIPFSSINFLKGTEQPLHSDYFHFATIPHNYLIGLWIALEDIKKDSGPLVIVEKSHKLPIITNEILKNKIPENEKQLKKNYTNYENFIKKIIKKNKLKSKELIIKKGEIILWDANTLHGAFKIKNRNLSRKSLVIHYHFSNCKKYYNPLYSLTSKNIYAERNINKLKIN